MLNTCLELKGSAVVTAAVFVHGSNMESVKRATFQIWHITGRGGGSAGGVVTSDTLGQHKVAEGSL